MSLRAAKTDTFSGNPQLALYWTTQSGGEQELEITRTPRGLAIYVDENVLDDRAACTSLTLEGEDASDAIMAITEFLESL